MYRQFCDVYVIIEPLPSTVNIRFNVTINHSAS